MLKEIECIVTGRVQMVMFRDFTQRKARKLGLVGTVQNMKDGSVKIVAQGTEDQLKKLIEYLNKGSISSKVKNIEEKWKDVSENFNDFEIIY